MLLTISTTHQPATDLGYLLHKHPTRLPPSERVVFEHARRRTVFHTTPNREDDVVWEMRADFEGLADGVAERFGYTARYLSVGVDKAKVGAPSQIVMFETNNIG